MGRLDEYVLMPRVSFRDFSHGLWLSSAKDTQAPSTLRRCKGVRPLLQPSIRSRWGCTQYGSGMASASDVPLTFFTLNGVRYALTDHNLQQVTTAAVSVVPAVLGFPRIRPVVAKMIPTIDTDVTAFPQGPVHVFIAGSRRATTMAKFSTAGRFSNWGILPPPDGFTASRVDEIKTVMEGFDTSSTWVFTNADPAVLGSASVIDTGTFQTGSASFKVTVPASSVVIGEPQAHQFPRGFNLIVPFANVESTDEDFITLWVQVDHPANLDSLDLVFGVSGSPPRNDVFFGSGFGKTFVFEVRVDSTSTQSPVVQPSGIADTPEFSAARAATFEPAADNQQRSLFQPATGALGDDVAVSKALEAMNALSMTTIPATDFTWVRLQIPRKAFTASDQALNDPLNAEGWGTVRAAAIVIKTNSNGPVTVWVDELAATLGEGMVGEYQYLLTYRNSKTGTRSNPNATPQKVRNVRRNSVALSNLPYTSGSDVDQIEVWRTVGNGSVFFFNHTLPNDPTRGTYFDEVADFFGLSTPRRPPADPDADTTTLFGQTVRARKFLKAIELPLDNVVPPPTCLDVCGPYLNRLFLSCDTAIGSKGRVYFTPPGRAEAIEGFLEVSNDDEPTQRTIIYNGALFTFTNLHVYEITGTGPFLAIEVLGVPGTTYRHTITVTPWGVLYLASDGVRIFNGQSSQLAYPEGILPLFQGQTATESGYTVAFPDPSALYSPCAALHHDEYLISDTTRTLALNLRTGVWRDVGKVTTALFCNEQELLAGETGHVFALEDPAATTDYGTAIPFEIEIPGTLVENQSGVTKLVQRLYLDLSTASQSLLVELIDATNTTRFSQTFGSSSRQRQEASLGLPCEVVSVRVSGSLVSPVEIFGVEFDVWVPEEAGFQGTA